MCAQVTRVTEAELAAELAERRIVDRAGVQSSRQTMHVQLFDTDHLELTDQTDRERMQGVLA